MIGKEVKLLTWLHGITLTLIILAVSFYIQFLILSPEAKHNYLVGLNNSEYPWQLNLCNALVFLIQLVYIGTAIYEIYRFGKSSRQFFANIEKTKLSYLRLFAAVLGVLTFLLLVCYATIPTRIVEYIIIPIICISIYVFVLYFAFQKSAIFAQNEYDDFAECLVPLKRYDDYSEPLCQEIKAIKANRGKYKIAEAEIESYYKKISEYFEKEKPYLHSDISLLTLSEAIGACSHHVSMTINVKFEMNFFNLINSYRIREAKYLLESNIPKTGATIEQIGYEVGFQTKSTFYNAFKTHVGASPTNYLKSIANDN
jgi:AraC-like DNA-binding protein